jgi:DNA-binding MarR family transcriptional regulator
MMRDLVDDLQAAWAEELPELDAEALSVVVRIQLLGRLLSRDAEQALEPLGLKLWEYDVLSALRRQGRPYSLPASELARESMLTSGAMTTRIDRLEERGLVYRQADKTDRRGVNVSLSEAGLRVVDDALAARLEAAETQLGSLAGRERAAISGGLRKLLLAQTASTA